MEHLIRELESLRSRPQLTDSQIVGAMIAAAARFKEILDDRMVGIESLATAVAMQPEIDARKLHDDFLAILRVHFDSIRRIPPELRDIAASIKLAEVDRH